jgi:hypothetical protein
MNLGVMGAGGLDATAQQLAASNTSSGTAGQPAMNAGLISSMAQL